MLACAAAEPISRQSANMNAVFMRAMQPSSALDYRVRCAQKERVMLAELLVGVAASLAFAQAPQAPNVGPPGPPPNGEQLYMENCAECHGPEGDVVPDV